MPILFQDHTPSAIFYGEKPLNKIFYNGIEVWSSIPPKDTLENMSWADIAAVCRAGLASEYWQLGDTKCLTDGDSSIQLQIIGFDHDIVTDPSAYGREKAGLTLQMMQLPEELNSSMNTTNYTGTSWHHSSSYYRCIVRSTLFPAFYESSVPEALKSVLVPVNKAYIQANDSSELEISDILFLPSNNEIFGNTSSGFGSEGTQYAYFAQGGTKIKKNTSGAAASWWTRSPIGNNAKFYQINASGVQTSGWVVNPAYAPPCMCI